MASLEEIEEGDVGSEDNDRAGRQGEAVDCNSTPDTGTRGGNTATEVVKENKAPVSKAAEEETTGRKQSRQRNRKSGNGSRKNQAGEIESQHQEASPRGYVGKDDALGCTDLGPDSKRERECHDHPANTQNIGADPSDPGTYLLSTYRYNQDTGLLVQPGGRDESVMKSSKLFVENFKTGAFKRVDEQKLYRPTSILPSRAMPRKGSIPLCLLANSVVRVTARCTSLVQGILSGWALMNLFLSYVWKSTRFGSSMASFLSFYSSVSMLNNRIFHTLVMMCFVFASVRYHHRRLALPQEEAKRTGHVDISILLVYLLAYLSTVLCTPLEDQLEVLDKRLDGLDAKDLSGGFVVDLRVWNAFNIARIVMSIWGWILVCTNMNKSDLSLPTTSPAHQQD